MKDTSTRPQSSPNKSPARTLNKTRTHLPIEDPFLTTFHGTAPISPPKNRHQVMDCRCAACQAIEDIAVHIPELQPTVKPPTDIRIGDRVMTRGDFTGTVKWIGLLDSRKYTNAPFYVGINLDDPVGNHDGTHQGKRYFHASAEYHGAFVRVEDVFYVRGRKDLAYRPLHVEEVEEEESPPVVQQPTPPQEPSPQIVVEVPKPSKRNSTQKQASSPKKPINEATKNKLRQAQLLGEQLVRDEQPLSPSTFDDESEPTEAVDAPNDIQIDDATREAILEKLAQDLAAINRDN